MLGTAEWCAVEAAVCSLQQSIPSVAINSMEGRKVQPTT